MTTDIKDLLADPIEREAQALAEHIMSRPPEVLERAREIIRARRKKE